MTEKSPWEKQLLEASDDLWQEAQKQFEEVRRVRSGQHANDAEARKMAGMSDAEFRAYKASLGM